MTLEVVSDDLKLLFGIEVTSLGFKLAIFSIHNLRADGNFLTLNFVELYTEELGIMQSYFTVLYGTYNEGFILKSLRKKRIGWVKKEE